MSRRTDKRRARQAGPVFAALGDDVRLTLITRLSRRTPLSITRLADGLPMTRQAVTKHLRVLEHAGLVRCRKSGREQHWELNEAPLHDARQYLDSISQQWACALQRLKAFAEQR